MLNFQIMEECLEVCGITVISALTVSDINSKLQLIFTSAAGECLVLVVFLPATGCVQYQRCQFTKVF